MERRLAECARLGFEQVICPRDRAGKLKAPKGIKLVQVSTLSQAVAALHLLASGASPES